MANVTTCQQREREGRTYNLKGVDTFKTCWQIERGHLFEECLCLFLQPFFSLGMGERVDLSFVFEIFACHGCVLSFHCHTTIFL